MPGLIKELPDQVALRPVVEAPPAGGKPLTRLVIELLSGPQCRVEVGQLSIL